MQTRRLTQLRDRRLVERGNRILDDLFRKGCHSVRQFSNTEADAKGCYRFLQNERISEADIITNLKTNCQSAAAGKFVVCIQDTTQINLGAHMGRLQPGDKHLGATNNKGTKGYGFLLHPALYWMPPKPSHTDMQPSKYGTESWSLPLAGIIVSCPANKENRIAG